MKREFILTHLSDYPVSRVCRLLGLGRGSFYWLGHKATGKRASEDQQLIQAIRMIHEASKRRYGSPKILDALRKQGFRCGKNRVARLMKKSGIWAVLAKKVPYKHAQRESLVVPNVLARRFAPPTKNTVWVTDITYLWSNRGWVYLCVFLDLFSRLVVGWTIGTSADTQLVLQTLQKAQKKRNPASGLLVHSDQGSQYTSFLYRDYLAAQDFHQSMSRSGNCWDNACCESFFSILKAETDLADKGKSLDELRWDIFEFIEAFYNTKRSHSTLDYQSPAEWERTKTA